MKEKNNVYMLFIETKSGMMKTISLIEDAGVKTLFNPDDRSPIKTSFMRMLNTGEDRIGFASVFPFSSDVDQYVMKGNISTFAKASPSMSSMFLEAIRRETNFSRDREIPYFKEESFIPVDTPMN